MSFKVNLNNPIVSIGRMNKEQLAHYPMMEWIQDRRLFEKGKGYQYSYEENLLAAGDLFKKSMEELSDSDTYVDIGAGNARAMIQYRDLFPNGAEVIGIANTLPNKNTIDSVIEMDKSDHKFTYYLSDFMDFDTEGLEGRVSVITDILGAMRYGSNPACVIQKVGKLLKEGGLVFFHFSSNNKVKIPSGYKFNVIAQEDAGSALFHYWFYTIRGFDVLQHNKTLDESKEHVKKIIKDVSKIALECFGNPGIIVLRRNNQPIEVDPLIVESSTGAGSCWMPSYSWNISEYSKLMLAENEKFNTD